jgi:salicylate hydroxylase
MIKYWTDLNHERTPQGQRSSCVTSSLLHLPDGPAARTRDAKLAAVPQDFGWIHEYDVQQALEASGTAPAARSRQEAR